jgi:hypothetical protein
VDSIEDIFVGATILSDDGLVSTKFHAIYIYSSYSSLPKDWIQSEDDTACVWCLIYVTWQLWPAYNRASVTATILSSSSHVCGWACQRSSWDTVPKYFFGCTTRKCSCCSGSNFNSCIWSSIIKCPTLIFVACPFDFSTTFGCFFFILCVIINKSAGVSCSYDRYLFLFFYKQHFPFVECENSQNQRVG